MKFFLTFLFELLVLSFYSCVDESLIGIASSGDLDASIASYQFVGSTRIGVNQDLSLFEWSDGDKIGVYGEIEGTEGNAAFQIKQGGSSLASFSNKLFKLEPNARYYAFYPYDPYATIGNYSIDLTNQNQIGNGSTTHIGEKNYMCSTFSTNAGGGASIQFRNLCAVFQIVVTVPHDVTFSSVTIESDNACFTTLGQADMRTGNITASEVSSSIYLGLGNGISLDKNGVFIANVLVAPGDLSSSELIVTIQDIEGNTFMTSFEGRNIERGKAYRFENGIIDEVPYLTFESDSEQRFRLISWYDETDYSQYPEELLNAILNCEYSIDGVTWSPIVVDDYKDAYTMASKATNEISFGGDKGRLHLRGKSSIGTSLDEDNFWQIVFKDSDAPIYVSGDIRTLIDYKNYDTISTQEARFCRLFRDCATLETAPELPSRVLATSCYVNMFDGCSSLKIAPELPAQDLSRKCYAYMFYNCVSLKNAPDLPALTLKDYCYYSMFINCSSLQKIKMMALKVSANGCLEGWTQGVAQAGSFIKNPEANLSHSELNIPSGWKIMGEIDGHEYVDLGLPSRLLWAANNIGAETIYDNGSFFAWGETDNSNKAYGGYPLYYGTENYIFNMEKGSNSFSLTKYCSNASYGYNRFRDNKTHLELADDVAYQQWGEHWTVPTRADFQELIDNCTFKFYYYNNIKYKNSGLEATGTNGNTLFFPETGTYTIYQSSDWDANYWTSECDTEDSGSAFSFYYDKDDYVHVVTINKSIGLAVRPVIKR